LPESYSIAITLFLQKRNSLKTDIKEALMKKPFIQFSIIISLTLAPCFIFSSQNKENKMEEVRAAVVDLYSALNAGNADAFVPYMASGGYTEFSEDGGPLFNIDEAYVKQAFNSGLRADFEIQELKVRVFGDTAVATGYRVGKFIIPNEATERSKLCLSMVWFCQEGKWKLVHVHLSPSKQ
jgi:ketosteroid isomerase-like protein